MLDKQSNAYLIFPDNIRVVSSPLLSSCPKEGILKPEEKASNARSTIERVLATTGENVVVLRHKLGVKKMVSNSI